jgi:hypothetical protein
MSRVAGFGPALLTEARFFSFERPGEALYDLPWFGQLHDKDKKKPDGEHRAPPIIFAQDTE